VEDSGAREWDVTRGRGLCFPRFGRGRKGRDPSSERLDRVYARAIGRRWPGAKRLGAADGVKARTSRPAAFWHRFDFVFAKFVEKILKKKFKKISNFRKKFQKNFEKIFQKIFKFFSKIQIFQFFTKF